MIKPFTNSTGHLRRFSARRCWWNQQESSGQFHGRRQEYVLDQSYTLSSLALDSHQLDHLRYIYHLLCFSHSRLSGQRDRGYIQALHQAGRYRHHPHQPEREIINNKSDHSSIEMLDYASWVCAELKCTLTSQLLRGTFAVYFQSMISTTI